MTTQESIESAVREAAKFDEYKLQVATGTAGMSLGLGATNWRSAPKSQVAAEMAEALARGHAASQGFYPPPPEAQESEINQCLRRMSDVIEIQSQVVSSLTERLTAVLPSPFGSAQCNTSAKPVMIFSPLGGRLEGFVDAIERNNDSIRLLLDTLAL